MAIYQWLEILYSRDKYGEGIAGMARRNRNKKPVSFFDGLTAKISKVEKQNILEFWCRLPKFHQRALMIISPLFVLILLLPTAENRAEQEIVVETSQRTEVTVDTTDLSSVSDNLQPVTKSDDWKQYSVKSGDTLAKVFRSNRLSMSDLSSLVKIEGLDKPLSKIKEGQLIRYKLTDNGELDILQLEKKNDVVMFFRLSNGDFGRSK